LEELGLKFIRFSTTQVEQNINQVLETIDAKVTTLTSSLNPSHLGREANSTPLSHQGRGAGGEGVPYGSEIESEDVQLELLPSSKPKQLSLAKTLTPVAYLWTRTVKCPNPACGASVPLVRQTWLCKKSKKYVALKVTPNYQTKQVEFEVVESTTEKGLGFDPAAGSTRGNSICRHCGTAIPSKPYIQEQGKAGKISYQLMAIVCTTPSSNGKTYLSGTTYEQYIPDEVNIKNDLKKLVEETEISTPNEPMKVWSGVFNAPLYGLDKFEKLFTTRQLLALMTFVKWVRLAHVEMMQQGYEEEFGKAIATYLGIMCDKQAMFNCSLTRWFNHREGICPVFSNQALPMVWDFIEGNPLCSGSGSWESAQQYVKEVILSESNETNNIQLQRGSAISLPFESSSLDAVITDPPYFDSVPYADLSDFFYVWLKRSIGHLYAEHFSGQLTPKKNEAIMEPSRHGGDKSKAAKAYEDVMHKAFCESSRVLKPGGVMVVVYAHKTTSGWVTLIDSLRRAGFTITEAWPLDTEMGSRLRGQNSAALASSIFLVARKRPHPASGSPLPILGEGLGERIGDYATEVKPQLAEIVKERVKTLMEEGVTGADLIIACVGAGLRAYTQYDRVELPNGDELDAQTFLDEVQKEVLETILADVLFCDKRGVSAVDKPTQYYILGRYEYGEAIVEFDEANTLARGVGVELDGVGGLTDGKLALVKKTKNQVQLRDYSERGSHEDLGIYKPEKPNSAPTLVDILHRLLWLAEKKPQDISNFIALAQPDANQLRLVAQALAGRTLIANTGQEIAINRTQEQRAIDTLLASWKRLIEDNLFTQSR
jgi:putative DNA methylase